MDCVEMAEIRRRGRKRSAPKHTGRKLSGNRTSTDLRLDSSRVGDQVGAELGLSRDQVEIILNCLRERAIVELMQVIGRSNRTKFQDEVLKPLMKEGWLERPAVAGTIDAGALTAIMHE